MSDETNKSKLFPEMTDEEIEDVLAGAADQGELRNHLDGNRTDTEPLRMSAGCHPDAGFEVNVFRGVIFLRCVVCGNPIVHVKVAPAQIAGMPDLRRKHRGTLQ